MINPHLSTWIYLAYMWDFSFFYAAWYSIPINIDYLQNPYFLTSRQKIDTIPIRSPFLPTNLNIPRSYSSTKLISESKIISLLRQQTGNSITVMMENSFQQKDSSTNRGFSCYFVSHAHHQLHPLNLHLLITAQFRPMPLP